jgi:hypothetical protein
MQAIVTTLVSLPFGQVHSLMQPLMQTLQEQDAAEKVKAE